MKTLSRVVINLSAMVALSMAAEQSFATTLPDTSTCVADHTCLQFGDFKVFSLALLNLQAGGTATSGPYAVKDSPGSILNNVVIGQGNGQSGAGSGIDGAYNVPSANTTSTFTTATTALGGGTNAFTGDTPGSWNATIGNLGLNGGPLVVYFGYNETGGSGLLNSDLLVWAQVSLYNYTSPSSFTVDPTQYTLGYTTAAPSLTTLPDPVGATATSVAAYGWVYIHSTICLDSSKQFVGFPDANGSCAYLGGTATGIQNNLGNNAAAFAIDSPGLDTALNSGLWNVMKVSWEMAYLNGGAETAFIETTTTIPPVNVPEPMTIALLGIGLLGLGISRRRTRSN